MNKIKTEDNMNTYTSKERNMYLLGLMGQNIIYNVISTGMTFYFQSVIFIPQMAIGFIMGIARIWDAINDPMMGTIVDRTRSKHGKCRPYLFYVPAIVMITTFLTFVNAQYSLDNTPGKNTLIIVWAGISYIMWGMTYTAGDIPIWGITSLMTESSKDREKLLGLARIIAGIGGGIALLGVMPLSQAVGLKLEASMETKDATQWGFIIVCGAMTLLGSLLFQCACFAKERVKQPSDAHKGFIDNVKIMWSCMPFRRLLISGIIKAPMQILSIVAMTLLSYYYGDNGGNGQSYVLQMVLLGGGLFIGQFGAMGITPKLCEKMEKQKLYNLCNIVGAIPFAILFIVYLIDGTGLYKMHWMIVLAVIFGVAGAAMGASMVIQSIMIADCVDYDEHRTGYRPDGVFFSGQSFITKLGAGLSSFIQSIVFAIVGFSDANIELCNKALAESPATDYLFATAPEFEPYRFGMFFLVSVPAAVSCVLSCIPMKNYEITNAEHKRIMEELNAKRNAG
ncbi:MAG: hypothetical protein E7544_09690 [Ruminococcaceae bacterium]|nr:hypothetical protein [Oscillospiraceae bacterium]